MSFAAPTPLAERVLAASPRVRAIGDRRRAAAQERAKAARDRDAAAHARDELALERDRLAEEHDRELAARDLAWARRHEPVAGPAALRAADDLRRAADDRVAAAVARARAAGDRRRAAADRELAAHDRRLAQADRELLLAQLAGAETDAVTGTRTRRGGLADLDHEIDRARRAAALLAVAYVDVLGVSAFGGARSDALLQRAVRTIRSSLRSYDLLVRLRDDELLCAMPDIMEEDARDRFRAIQTALADDRDPCEIRVGFAALRPHDDVQALVERAGLDLATRH